MGVSQATEAIGLALEERIANFTFTYTGGQPQLNPHVLRDLPPTPCNTAPARQRQQAASAPHTPSQGKLHAQVGISCPHYHNSSLSLQRIYFFKA